MKLTYLLAAVLALTLAGTGCQKRPTGVTPINKRDIVVRPGEGMTELPPVNSGETGLGSKDIGGGAQSETYNNLENFNQDRSTLGANTVHFDYDSSVVKGSEKGNLDAVANYMKSNGSVGLLVEGHCDERGTEDYNNSLGERRATALREALINLGVDAGHVVTRSYGEYKPVAQGHDESAYHQNRRGEFVVLHPK